MTRNKFLPRETKSVRNATELRKNLTKQERHLWYDFLKLLPVHFYRQYTIEKYIVDFFCPKANLAIEIDGSDVSAAVSDLVFCHVSVPCFIGLRFKRCWLVISFNHYVVKYSINIGSCKGDFEKKRLKFRKKTAKMRNNP